MSSNDVSLPAGARGFELDDAVFNLRGLAVILNLPRKDYALTWVVAPGPLATGPAGPLGVRRAGRADRWR